MKKRLSRWLALMVLMGMGAVIAVNAFAYRHAHAMMHFSSGSVRTEKPENLSVAEKARVLLLGINVPRPRSGQSPRELDLNARSLRLDGTNNIKLGAWLCPGSPQKPLVILFHGYSSEKSTTLPQAKAFLDMGLSVLLVDFRGSGESSESYTTMGFDEAEDVAAAMRFAQKNFPHRQIILYGQSMGAAAILRAVHSSGACPDGIILESVFDNMLNTTRHRFETMGVPSFPGADLLVFWGGRQAGFNGFRHNPVDYATAVRCPTLFLHGTADSRARVEDGRRVFAAIPARKHFKEFPGLGHEALLIAAPNEWKTAVRELLGNLEK